MPVAETERAVAGEEGAAPSLMSENGERAGTAAADNAAMFLDPDQCYRALRTHDTRFDGRFFVGVGTTGIYCRPVCTAKTPLARNCRYFPSAAAAEGAGYRPCLRCRPELAPGYASVDANRRLAQAAAGLIEDGRLEDASLAELAATLDVTDRHLRRVFQQEFGVSPVDYAQTQRLLLAKRLLTDTALPVLDVAMASGFASLRRFNDLFRTRYRMTPGDLRRSAPARASTDRLSFDLAFRPPYDWPAMLAFLARRAIASVEAVDGRRYRRTIRLERAGKVHTGWIEVAPSPRKSALRVTASASLAGAVPALLAHVKPLFDLACRPDEIAAVLGPLARTASRPAPAGRHRRLRDRGARDPRAAGDRCRGDDDRGPLRGGVLGEPIATPYRSLDRLFPPAAHVARLEPPDIAALGIIAARARAIVALAKEVAAGNLKLERTAPVEPTLAALERIPGIGPWTAHYIAMRALAWPDAFPHPDVAVLKAMGESSGKHALARAEAWRPWRAYAVLHLWKSLEQPASPKP